MNKNSTYISIRAPNLGLSVVTADPSDVTVLRHITLAFLGQINGQERAEAHAACRDAASSHSAFNVALSRAVAEFPPHAGRRVIFLGLSRDEANLQARMRLHALRSTLLACLRSRDVPVDLSFEEDNVWVPHVTLARVPTDATVDVRWNEGADAYVPVDAITLHLPGPDRLLIDHPLPQPRRK